MLSQYREIAEDLLADFRTAANALLGSEKHKSPAYTQEADFDEQLMGIKGALTIDLERGADNSLVAKIDSTFQHEERPEEHSYREFSVLPDVARTADFLLADIDEKHLLSGEDSDNVSRMTAVVGNLIIALRESTDTTHRRLSEELGRKEIIRDLRLINMFAQHIPITQILHESNIERHYALCKEFGVV